jgi:long-chain acyl-CoA synthetase
VGGYNRRRAPELDSWSIPHWFLARCAATPHAVAFRYKDMGLYQEVTWQAYRDACAAFLAGLEALGLQRGERVAAMSDPCREFFIGDMAAMCGGAICYGIYTTCSVDEVEYQLQNGEAAFFLAEDQEFVDKALQAPSGLPHVRKIIVFDTRALFQYTDDRLISFDEVARLGQSTLAGQDPAAFLKPRAEAIKANDIAVLVYTSGTTGPPKGAMHDHASLMWGFANAYLEAFPELNDGIHRAVSHLPVAHLIERTMSMCLPLVADVIPHTGEEVEDLPRTLYEVQPTYLNVVPRILEKIASQVTIGIQRSSFVKRHAYAWAMRVGRAYRERCWAGERPGVALSLLRAVATVFVFQPLLKKTGLSKIRAVFCAGAPLPLKIQELWEIWGVNVRNLYGITEGSYVLCQRDAFPAPTRGGFALFPREVKLGHDGELMVRGPGLFRGYWKNPDGTRAALLDGWLVTGDIADASAPGEWRIVDRKKDIMITSGGKNIAPSEIENLLKSSPYISEAALIGDGRRFVTALIEIDFACVSEWARQNRVVYTSFTSLTEADEVVGLIGREIDAVNDRLSRVEQVKKFRILPKELDPEEGDTTPTRKIKRKHLCTLFESLIEDMYAGAEASALGEALAHHRRVNEKIHA